MKWFINEIREMVKEEEYPQEFSPEDWNDALEASCVSYALGIHVNMALLIGDIIGERVTRHNDISEIIYVLCREIEKIGFEIEEVSSDDEVYDENSFKIFVEFDEDNLYHLYRQDADGSWSHKASGCFPTKDNIYGSEVQPEEMNVYEGHYFILRKVI